MKLFQRLFGSPLHMIGSRKGARGAMPIYHPIEIPLKFQCSVSDMHAIDWAPDGIAADFYIPSSSTEVLRVSFDRACIIRVLDEMALSTEEDSRSKRGLVSENFAYRVENSAFAAAQSDGWKDVFGPVFHWCFITGWTCFDVLSAASPSLLRGDAASQRPGGKAPAAVMPVQGTLSPGGGL
ncbi:hypothetical protein IAI18_21680 [Acetobacteraceae bacterium H6797]|nr:hypothetical protein [Acetobacteraceae bacterium H6797]